MWHKPENEYLDAWEQKQGTNNVRLLVFLCRLNCCLTWKNINIPCHLVVILSFPSFVESVWPPHVQSFFGGCESYSVKVRLGWVWNCLMFPVSKTGVPLFDVVNRFQTQLLLCLLLEKSLAWQLDCGNPESRWKLVRGGQKKVMYSPTQLLLAHMPREWAFFASCPDTIALGAIAGAVTFCLAQCFSCI